MMPQGGGDMLRRNRALEELLRLARKVIANGRVSEDEAELFRRWVEDHPDMLGVKVVDDVARALRRIFADGRADPAERAELGELLQAVSGEGETAPDDTFGKLPPAPDEEHEV